MVTGRCEKCGKKTEKKCKVLDRTAFWCGCGYSEKRYGDPRFVAKAKRGRPPTERGAGNPHPGRKLGRVSEEDWQIIQAAFEAEKAEGKATTFTAWAVRRLKRKR